VIFLKTYALFDDLIHQISKKVKTEEFLIDHRVSSRSFTRKRKMPFENLLFFMLNSAKKSIQIELTDYMGSFTTHKNITKSAYCQQRMNLKHTAFIELNDDLVNGFYEKAEYKRWNGFRLMSIDGSTLMLPYSDKIRDEFGVNSESNNVPMARVTTLFDLLNEVMVDSLIRPNISAEINMAVEHFQKLKQGDLLILDRGFGARWLFCILLNSHIDFVTRIQHGFGEDVDSFWDSKKTSKIIRVEELPEKSKQRLGEIQPFEFRLVKFLLENGETEVLATSLLDETKYPTEIFKELYRLRWGVETNYNHLKNHIEIGNFSGYTPHVIRQDFFANVMISNMQSLIIKDAQLKLDEQKKGLKYKYKINRNLSLGYMKNRVIEILMSDSTNQYEELISLFLIEPVPIRLGRTFPRNPKKHKRRFYLNQKRSL
jgi:hypothetical protein